MFPEGGRHAELEGGWNRARFLREEGKEAPCAGGGRGMLSREKQGGGKLRFCAKGGQGEARSAEGGGVEAAEQRRVGWRHAEWSTVRRRHAEQRKVVRDENEGGVS